MKFNHNICDRCRKCKYREDHHEFVCYVTGELSPDEKNCSCFNGGYDTPNLYEITLRNENSRHVLHGYFGSDFDAYDWASCESGEWDDPLHPKFEYEVTNKTVRQLTNKI